MSAGEQVEMPRNWVTYSEAQVITGLGRTSLWKLVSAGEIRAARIGRTVRISRQSLEEFMENHTMEPQLPGFDDVGQ